MSDEASEAVEDFIEQMKSELGVELDRELAAQLQISPTAVAGWRSRKRIPSKYQLRFRRVKDEGADNISGPQPTHRLRSAYIFRLIDVVSRRLHSDEYDYLALEFVGMWRGYRLADAYSYFTDMLPENSNSDALREGFEALSREIATDDFINWIENLGT